MCCVLRGIFIAVLAATASGAFAQQWGGHPRREDEPKLYSANGKLVGVVIDAPMGDGSDGGVLMDVNGAPVMVGFALEKAADGSQSANRLIWSGVSPSYSGADCTGTPRIPYVLGPLRPAAIERKGATATLLVANDEPSRMMLVRSTVYPSGCGNYLEDASFAAWPVGYSLNLTDRYPEPLRIGN